MSDVKGRLCGDIGIVVSFQYGCYEERVHACI